VAEGQRASRDGRRMESGSVEARTRARTKQGQRQRERAGLAICEAEGRGQEAGLGGSFLLRAPGVCL
jgi:hypothetical protein